MAEVPTKEPPFTTWTFKSPCMTMSWNELHVAQLLIGSEAASVDTVSATADGGSDLVLIGLQAPAPKEEDEEAEGKDSPPPEIVLTGVLKGVDESVKGELTALLQENQKEFKQGSKLGSALPTLRVSSSKRYVVYGLGTAPKAEEEKEGAEKKDPFEGAGLVLGKAVAAKCHAEKKVKTCSIVVPDEMAKNPTFLQDFSTSFYSELYADNRFRTGPRITEVAPDLKRVTIVPSSAALQLEQDAATASLEKGKNITKGVFMARDIINAPHNVLNSLSMADTARRIAEESNGTLSCTVLDYAECEKRGMGAYLAVGRGSEAEPQFIHITYKPKDEVKTRVGIVGKGVVFDTGGYNIKLAMMELMKFDCGGAAAVLGAARTIGALAPSGVEAHFIVAACDNMINDKAYVPSDILTASNGMTIEIGNTDTEGRLTLADALVYADKEAKCDEIIELSTLTGSCMIALGKEIAAFYTANESLAAELQAASKSTGDKIWRMPLEQSYAELNDSKIADIKNLGGPWGGSITAALFLTRFVDKKKPFSHLDMAGPVWSEKLGMATGYGSKLVTAWVCKKGVTK